MEKTEKELRLKLRVLEKLMLMRFDEKALNTFGAKEFFEIYKKHKLSEAEGEILLELIEAVKKKRLYSYLEVTAESGTDNAEVQNEQEQ